MKNIIQNKPYRLGVNAIVVDIDDNFLLVQKNGYKENEWNFLGGGREEGETLEQNLFRELNEEIGTTKSDFEIIGISSFKIEYGYPADTALRINGGKYCGQSYVQVILRFIGDKSNLFFSKEEFRTHKWVKAKELENHLIFPNQYQNHQKAINELMPGILTK